MKIDAFAHLLPLEYRSAVLERVRRDGTLLAETEAAMAGARSAFEMWETLRGLTDIEKRIADLDDLGIDMQVVTPPVPPLEAFFHGDHSVELAAIANETLSAAVREHSDRFLGVGMLSMHDPDVAARELRRCVEELGLVGVVLFAAPSSPAFDAPELDGVFAAANELEAPIWVHPWRSTVLPGIGPDRTSSHLSWYTFGWPYETSVALTALVLGGVLEKYPKLNVIAHHGGGMIPFFVPRIEVLYADDWLPYTHYEPATDTRPLLEGFRRIYADTAGIGNVNTLMNVESFFGAGQIVFGSDAPYDAQDGRWLIERSRDAVAAMDVTEEEAEQIWSGNLARLCKLQGAAA
ncbi:MAG TPA: amidohydrolase family protein [Solirubrobacteraceae bacterium]|nr:amidohydrolase family protein [Solirubrobacteraceae bacterium]